MAKNTYSSKNKAENLGCDKIVEDFVCLAVERYNLVDEREIAKNFEKKNEIMIAMFADDYSENHMQERLTEEQAMISIPVKKQLQKSKNVK